MTTLTLTEENCRLLEKCQIFSAIDKASRLELATRAYRKTFIAGEKVFDIGSPGQSMMAVCTGSVRITFPSTTGKEMILSDLSAGEVFGEVSLLDGHERSANAVSLTNSELLILERRDVMPFLENNPQTCLKLLSVLCGRLRRANELMADIAFYDLPVRLAKMLLRLSTVSAGAAEPTFKTKISSSQIELANMIGASRENVNRCLKEWQRRDIVNLEDGWIILLTPSELEKIAAS